jgi:hypothetical protein
VEIIREMLPRCQNEKWNRAQKYLWTAWVDECTRNWLAPREELGHNITALLMAGDPFSSRFVR